MSDTPETDAEAMDGMNDYGDPLKPWDYKASKDGEVVPAEFARRLESERDEARKELAAVAQILSLWEGAVIRRLERERDEARRELSGLKARKEEAK